VRPGGRLAFLVWGPPADQTWLTVPAAAAMAQLPLRPEAIGTGDEPGIFGLARPERTTDLLTRAGWFDVAVERHQLPVVFAGGGTVDEAVAFLAETGPARALLEGVAEATARRALDAAGEALAEHLTPDGVVFSGGAWLVSARR
jgi:hypothetical protein